MLFLLSFSLYHVHCPLFPLPCLLFWALGGLLALQSALALREGYRYLGLVRHSRNQPPAHYAPPLSLIIPCKGIDSYFDVNIRAFLAQDYPAYQVIFVVGSHTDPAYAKLAELIASRSGPIESHRPRTDLVVAQPSDSRGEKVNNLFHGLSAVDPNSEILAFADSDAHAKPDWLRSLAAPLADRSNTVSTGFRWYLPGRGLVSRLLAAWDTSLATVLGDHDYNFAWGGSMAIRVSDFKRLRIAEHYWNGTVSDDYAVRRAAKDSKGRIYFQPRCLLASHSAPSFREFLSWANRQIVLTRVYAPSLWVFGLLTHGFYCCVFLFGAILLFWPRMPLSARLVNLGLLGLIMALVIAKGRVRSVVARELFPQEAHLLARYGGCYWRLAPLLPWLMFFNFSVAGFKRRIEWRGTHYELVSAQEVRILNRRDL